MKAIELKVLIELIKNSRRSDRELAKAVGSSQPTVSRTIKKLEKEGIIKEYTVVPDFSKLGFQIMAVLLTKSKPFASVESMGKIKREVLDHESGQPSSVLMAMKGDGLGFDNTAIVLSERYSEFSKSIQTIKQLPNIDVDAVRFFVIDLADRDHFVPLTFSNLAKYLERKQKLWKSETTVEPKP